MKRTYNNNDHNNKSKKKKKLFYYGPIKRSPCQKQCQLKLRF